MDTGCRGNRGKRRSGKKRFVMNTRIAVAMTQNTEYVPKKDTDDVTEDEDVDAHCPPSEDDDKQAKKGKKRKHPSCQSNEEEEPKLKKKSPPVKEGERKLTKKRDHHVKHQRPVCHKKKMLIEGIIFRCTPEGDKQHQTRWAHSCPWQLTIVDAMGCKGK